MEVSLGKECIVILLLIFGNGIFSLLEMSIVSCHQPRLEAMAEEGSKSAKIVLKLRENPNKMFSAVQFGITLMGLLTGVYGGTEMAGPMSQYVAMIPGLEPYAYSVSLTTIVAVITYLTIILGEIVPKRIAINKPEAIACFLARPMLYFCTVSTPPHLVSVGFDGLGDQDHRHGQAGGTARNGRGNQNPSGAGRGIRGV